MGFRTCEIYVQRDGPADVVGIRGAVDASSFDEFQHVMDKLVGKKSPRIIVDCSELEHLNCHAIGYLVQAERQIMDKSGKLILQEVSPAIQESIEDAEAKNNLILCDSRKEALANL